MNEWNPQPQQQQTKRFMPISDIEFMSFTTATTWGKPENISPALLEKLKNQEYFKAKDQEGKERLYVDITPYWELLGFYTQDIRLANLESLNGEFDYCAYYLDLAGDFLASGYIKGFQGALRKVITRLELSQSRGGFLRKRMNTISSESKQEILEPKKNNILGVKKE